MGRDPLDRDDLRFVYEDGLQVLPTAATVLAADARNAPLAPMPEGLRPSTIDRARMVHGEQKVELHRPLPTRGRFVARSRVKAAYDKGEGRGAIVINETVWTDGAGAVVATLTNAAFARGDGGFGGPAGGPPPVPPRPGRAPDLRVELETRPDQALLYRLNGDRNPLHADPEVARRAGFERPILHGLCTFGLTARAVLRLVADHDPTAVLSHEARFSAPVFPGDDVVVDLWREDGAIWFEARAPQRDAVVIRNGLARLR
jgi:acyl dehydratase